MQTIGDLHRAAKVDKTHLIGGVKINGWICNHPDCGKRYTSLKDIEAQVSGGTWGPNGNGWLYFSKCHHYYMSPVTK